MPGCSARIRTIGKLESQHRRYRNHGTLTTYIFQLHFIFKHNEDEEIERRQRAFYDQCMGTITKKFCNFPDTYEIGVSRRTLNPWALDWIGKRPCVQRLQKDT